MEYQKIMVVITSALFSDQQGGNVSLPSANRVARLQRSITSLSNFGLTNFVLLDNTLPNGFKTETILQGITINLITPILIEPPIKFLPNEYQENGPSRLEAVLLYQARSALFKMLQDFEYVLKISAGYQIRNLDEILSKTENGVVYRMCNPFRKVIKFCLTSFYILPVQHFLDLSSHFYGQINTMSNLKPLEYHLYTYIKSIQYQAIAINYPVLDADFLSSGRSSADLDYKLKELVFRLLAKLGVYAFQPK